MKPKTKKVAWSDYSLLFRRRADPSDDLWRTTFYSRRGFTLLEALLAATLFVVVASSSFGIFQMGTQIWKRSQGRSMVERKSLFAIEKLAKDLRMAIRVQGEDNRGKGTSSSLDIPSVLNVKIKEDEFMMQYGFVRYRFDSAKNELCRSEVTASDLAAQKDPPCQGLAKEVDSVRFRYLIYEGIGDSYSWYDAWDEKEEMPIAVEMTLTLKPLLKGEKYPTRKVYQQTFLLPSGGMIKEQDEEKDKTTETAAA